MSADLPVKSAESPAPPALFADLYELTMAQAFSAEGMNGRAVFETFFRRMPDTRSFMIAAGLDRLLGFLENHAFRADELDYLRGLGRFTDGFLDQLSRLRFTGDVWAMPEGTAVFENEPIVQVVAPLIEAQLVETYAVNQVHLHTVLASKAARVVLAAGGRQVVDFGARRAHGADAALALARTSYLVGADGTSNLEAGRRYGIPVFGTMAHSFIQAFDDEPSAFEAFVRHHPHTTLLVDTYDTLGGIDNVIALARRLGDRFSVQAVRLDSGDLGELARAARARLDAAGLHQVTIFASSSLDEYAVAELVARGAPIDGFGVGTRMAVAQDAPDLDMVYKLVEYEGRPRSKRSPGKFLHPFRKQVHRRVEGGRARGDLVTRFDESAPGTPLLVEVMRGGRRTEAGRATLEDARRRCAVELAALPESLRSIAPALPYPVAIEIR